MNVNETPQIVTLSDVVEPGQEQGWERYSAQVYERMLRTAADHLVVRVRQRFRLESVAVHRRSGSTGDVSSRAAVLGALVTRAVQLVVSEDGRGDAGESGGAVVYALCVAGGDAGPFDAVSI